MSDEQQDFVGLWKNHQTSLLITESGRIEYESNKGSLKKSLSVPIQEINEKELTAGVLFFSTTFELDGRPSKEDGLITLTVDGEKLYKTNALGVISQSSPMPTLDEIRSYVNKELALLSKGINTKDFSEYIENSSMVFQSQFTNEDLVQNYKSFMDQNINISQWMIGEFSLLKEPAIDGDGVLRIYGKYPNPKSNNALQFKLSYVYSNNNWKGIGGTVNIAE